MKTAFLLLAYAMGLAGAITSQDRGDGKPHGSIEPNPRDRAACMCDLCIDANVRRNRADWERIQSKRAERDRAAGEYRAKAALPSKVLVLDKKYCPYCNGDSLRWEERWFSCSKCLMSGEEPDCWHERQISRNPK